MQSISQVISKLRLHLSQSEIARRTGIQQSKLSRWEAGEVAAGAEDALKLVALSTQLAKKRRPTTEQA